MNIITPNPADLVGYKTLPIDVTRLAMLLQHCEDVGTKYLMGAKPDEPKGGTPFMWPPTWHDEQGRAVNACDCSGFGRYAIWFATHGKVVIPDGTSAQFDYFDSGGFKSYGADGYVENGGKKDGHVRVCICTSEDGKPYGHFWFDLNGATEESYGGNGPGSRAFSAPVLERIVRRVFVVS